MVGAFRVFVALMGPEIPTARDSRQPGL